MPAVRFHSRHLTVGLGLLLAAAALSTHAQPAAAAAPANNVLSIDMFEGLAAIEGIVSMTEVKLDGPIAKVSGFDIEERHVKLTFDRATGEVLRHKVKQPKPGKADRARHPVSSTQAYVATDQLERAAADEGVVAVRKIKLDGRLAKVSGADAEGNRIKLTVDRKTGETLQYEIKPPKPDKAERRHRPAS